MTFADWFWVAFMVFLLLAVVVLQCREINQRRDNARAIDAERTARENTKPNGSVDVWGWPR